MDISGTTYQKLEDSPSFYRAQPPIIPPTPAEQVRQLPERTKLSLKFGIFLLCTTLIVIGRFSVPDNEPKCVLDKVQDALNGVNYFILNNTAWRDALQIMCSGFMDVFFLVTGGYWIVHGSSCRLIITVILFYVVRAMVQALWESPFPPGFWWYNPGFPSLVVPYGRGSDFFFSGHIGFVTICWTEWKTNKKPYMVGFTTLGGLYTMFILLSYQVHYCIDIFTGIIFAHWCFMVIDGCKESLDNFFFRIFLSTKKLLTKKKTQDVEVAQGEIKSV